MTEQITDDREITYTTIPYLKVVRLQENPDGQRYYCVMEKMIKDGAYAGWKHVSKGYEHSTSAFAAMGRLVQEYIRKDHPHLPENER